MKATHMEEMTFIELARLIGEDYAVAFRKIDSKTIGIRAVKDNNIIEVRAPNVKEAMHALFRKFTGMTADDEKRGE